MHWPAFEYHPAPVYPSRPDDDVYMTIEPENPDSLGYFILLAEGTIKIDALSVYVDSIVLTWRGASGNPRTLSSDRVTFDSLKANEDVTIQVDTNAVFMTHD